MNPDVEEELPMPEVRVYKTSRCPYCTMAIRFLREAKKIDPKIIDITGNSEERTRLYSETGSRTVPQIFVGEVHIGGYDELRSLDRKGGLDPLLGI